MSKHLIDDSLNLAEHVMLVGPGLCGWLPLFRKRSASSRSGGSSVLMPSLWRLFRLSALLTCSRQPQQALDDSTEQLLPVEV